MVGRNKFTIFVTLCQFIFILNNITEPLHQKDPFTEEWFATKLKSMLKNPKKILRVSFARKKNWNPQHHPNSMRKLIAIHINFYGSIF